MEIKRYNKDWAKSGAREGLGGVIDRNVLRKAADCKVAHFSGVDCQEAKEVYFPRGFLAENVIAIERENKIANLIEEQDTGMPVYRGTADDFFEEIGPFYLDVVSLDYIGPINREQLSTIRKVVTNQQLDTFVLHVANLLRRDHAAKELYCVGYSMGFDEEEILNGSGALDPEKSFIETARRTNHIGTKVAQGESIQEEKGDSYSSLISVAVTNSDVKMITEWLKFITGNEYFSCLRNVEDDLSQLVNSRIRLDRESPFESRLPQVLSPLLDTMLRGMAQDCFRYECGRKGMGVRDADVLMMAYTEGMKQHTKYQVIDSFNYSYISESGAPMIGNVLALHHQKKQTMAAKKIARLLGYPGKLGVFPSKKLQRAVNKYVNAHYWRNKKPELEDQIRREKNRVFIGSSAKPVLSKRRAIEELKNGATIDEIQEKYRGGKNLSLPQIKAHVSMGTYGPTNVGRSVNQRIEEIVETDLESAEDTEVEKITKEEMLDLLGSGIPPQEIFDSYPTSFSLMQLRGHKANITRQRNLEK